MKQKKVRLGLVGYGGIGTVHCKNLNEGKAENVELVAICDHDKARLDMAKEKYPHLKHYLSADEMYADPDIDAVMIAVPHYDHPTLAIAALKAGKHTMTEKPAGVYGKQVLEMIDVAEKSDKVFGIMFNMRCHPVFTKLRGLIQSGALGTIKRVTWTVTDWYRPQPYHVRNDWCSTWEGEGGGTLVNQNPHNLDMWQWLFGMPDKVTAFCEFGKYYDIDVDDEVVAHLKYNNGMTGVYVTSTGEYPGTNCLEIACDMGTLKLEKYEKITFVRNEISERVHNANLNDQCFGGPAFWNCEIPVDVSKNEVHIGIFKNFANAILNGTPLLAPGKEGIKGVTLANAMYLSSWTGKTVEINNFPHDEYYKLLCERIKNSKYPKRKIVNKNVADFNGTFGGR